MTQEQDRKAREKRMMDKQDKYAKPELSESKDMCKQCEFVVARLSGHLLSSATEEPLPDRAQWMKRMPRYCEPLNTKACLHFLKVYGGLLSDELGELSVDVRELGEDEPSLSNAALRARLCDDVTEACQKHHNVIRSAEVAVVVRNRLKSTKANLFWITQDADGVWQAVVPEAMRADRVVLPGDAVRFEAKRGHQFVLVPDGIPDEDDAPRFIIQADGPDEQHFELTATDDTTFTVLAMSATKKPQKSSPEL